LILHSVVYRDVTRQAKGLHCLKYVGALERGLVYLSRCNSGWFCHMFHGEKGAAAVGHGHGGDVPACWGLKRLGEVVQELPRDDVVLLE
jgi:hypothetical protein